MVALFAGMVAPFLIGVSIIGLLGWFYFKFHYAFDEMIVLVDENNNAISTAAKLATHHSETPLHRAFSVFLFNDKGELLLQKRADNKKTWAGIWSNSCCGHLMLHETLENAAARRLKFELGLRGVKLRNILPKFRYRAEKDGVAENEICPVLVGSINKTPRLNLSEASDFKWIPWKLFCVELNSIASEYSPWSILEAKQLQNSTEFQIWFSENIKTEAGELSKISNNNSDQIKAKAA
jgi:isopentenyl-diphosphate Delta-isomerase